MLALLVLGALPACFSPQRPACAFSCAGDGLCPSGYACLADRLCHRDDEPQAACGLTPPGDGGDGDADNDGAAQ